MKPLLALSAPAPRPAPPCTHAPRSAASSGLLPEPARKVKPEVGRGRTPRLGRLRRPGGRRGRQSRLLGLGAFQAPPRRPRGSREGFLPPPLLFPRRGKGRREREQTSRLALRGGGGSQAPPRRAGGRGLRGSPRELPPPPPLALSSRPQAPRSDPCAASHRRGHRPVLPRTQQRRGRGGPLMLPTTRPPAPPARPRGSFETSPRRVSAPLAPLPRQPHRGPGRAGPGEAGASAVPFAALPGWNPGDGASGPGAARRRQGAETTLSYLECGHSFSTS